MPPCPLHGVEKEVIFFFSYYKISFIVKRQRPPGLGGLGWDTQKTGGKADFLGAPCVGWGEKSLTPPIAVPGLGSACRVPQHSWGDATGLGDRGYVARVARAPSPLGPGFPRQIWQRDEAAGGQALPAESLLPGEEKRGGKGRNDKEKGKTRRKKGKREGKGENKWEKGKMRSPRVSWVPQGDGHQDRQRQQR